jgi:hypothetical protein
MNQDDWLRKRMRGKKRPGCAPEIGAFVLVAVAMVAAYLL